MAKKEMMSYLDEFIECGEIQGKCTLDGDYKTGNKAYHKMQKILLKAKDSDEKEEFYLAILESSSDATTLIVCCSHMLKLNIKPDMARQKLEQIVKDKEIHSIYRFEAEMFLQEWDKGNITRIYE